MNLASPRMGGAKRLCFTSQRTQRDSNPQPPTAPTSLSTRRVLCHLRAMRPVILFPDYRLGNQTQGCTDTLLLTAKVSGFEVAQTPTVNERQKSYFFSSPFCAARASLPMRPTCFAARSFISRCCGVASPRCTASAARL